jgi:hypothetical protein
MERPTARHNRAADMIVPPDAIKTNRALWMPWNLATAMDTMRRDRDSQNSRKPAHLNSSFFLILS